MATLEEIDETDETSALLSAFKDEFKGNKLIKISTFQEFYDSVCDRIRSSGTIDDLVKEFETLHNDYQRSKFAMEVPEVRQLQICTNYCKKNADKALQFEHGYDSQITNEAEVKKALQMISQSVKLTPTENSTALSRRYMKRGWASLMLENFKEAKTDAERSLQHEMAPEVVWNSHEILGHFYAKEGEFRVAEQHFQEALSSLRNSSSSNEEKARAAGRISLVYKNIKGRKLTKTKKSKSKGEEYPHLPKVAYGPHSLLESATEAVNVIVKEPKGRCLFANKELCAGDVIIVEEPFAASLSNECMESHCSTCFKRLTITSVPCETCSSVWFCDEDCRRNELSPHSKECKFLLLLNDNAMSKMATLVYRILLKQTWKKLKEKKKLYIEVLDHHKIMKNEILNTKPKYSSKDFETIFSLVTNDGKRSFGDMFKRSLTAVFLVYILEKTGFFMGDSAKENILYITSIALRLLQGVSCNAYGITECLTGAQGPAQAELLEIGGAVYPTISLTNHSCWPNASRYSVGTTCILRATRNIPKGSEVYDNYGQHFISVDLSERHELLKSQYKFDCGCEACFNNWSIYPHTNVPHLTFMCPIPNCHHPNVFVKGLKQCSKCGEKKRFLALCKQINNKLSEFNRIINLIKSGQTEIAFKSLLEYQRFLDQHSVPPGKIISDSQEAIRQCFTLIGNSYKVTPDNEDS